MLFLSLSFLDDGWINIQGENPQPWAAPAKSCSVFQIDSSSQIAAGSLLNHLGLPVFKPSGSIDVNIYPLYMYYKVVNDWFRDENLEAEFGFDTTNGTYGFNSVPLINGQYVNGKGSLFKVAKFHDVFTSALPAPQNQLTLLQFLLVLLRQLVY